MRISDWSSDVCSSDLTGAIGVFYETPVSDRFKIGLNANVRYSDSYLASGFGNPLSRQDSYTTLDAGIRFGAEDDNWQIALIGKNLTNEFYVTGVVDGPGTRSEEHTSELQSLMRISYAVFCLKKKKITP